MDLCLVVPDLISACAPRHQSAARLLRVTGHAAGEAIFLVAGAKAQGGKLTAAKLGAKAASLGTVSVAKASQRGQRKITWGMWDNVWDYSVGSHLLWHPQKWLVSY